MTSKAELLPEVLKKLHKSFGENDHISEWFPFTYTDFYAPEMGADLKRCIVSFKRTLPSQYLPKAKKWTQKVEKKFMSAGKRRVNIDAGYMDHCKVVLASGKFGGHKIALTEECYADMILDYEKGTFRPFPWCFPDFRSGVYNSVLGKIRSLFKADVAAKLALPSFGRASSAAT